MVARLIRLVLWAAIFLGAVQPASAGTATPIWNFYWRWGGYAPIGGLVQDKAGALYGVTYLGGYFAGAGYGNGVIYKMTPPPPGSTRWSQTIIYRFRNGTDGGAPVGELTVGPDGALYGAVSEGGMGTGGVGWGAIYRLAPPTPTRASWQYSVIYRFNSILDGRSPAGGVVFDNKGVLYGVTALGGNGAAAGPLGGGILYSLTPSASGIWTKKTLYVFAQPGAPYGPSSSLVRDASGALYGTTYRGGRHDQGTTYRLARDVAGVWRMTILHSFGNPGPGVSTDGERPDGPLAISPNGSIFGVTYFGGRSSSNGVVYKLTPPAIGQTAWTETLIYVFSNDEHDGSQANGVILDGAGGLYGTTLDGGGPPSGPALNGTLYHLTPPAGGVGLWKKTMLHSFAGAPRDGRAPMGKLLLSNGTIYGVTQSGGQINVGTVYKYVLP